MIRVFTDPIFILVRMDMGVRIPHIVGAFSSEEKALDALSLDVTDNANAFANTFTQSSDNLKTWSVTDGEKVFMLWNILSMSMDTPVFCASAAHELSGDGLCGRPPVLF